MKAGRELDALVAEKVFGYVFADAFLAHYSTDIADAWQLIERHPHYVYVIRSNEDKYTGKWKEHMTWRCRFYAPEKFEIEADTAPLAICLAALKALGVEVEE